MRYIEALHKFGKDFDPFLHIKKEEIIDKWKFFVVTCARAPYAKDHLILIPTKKVYLLKDLEHKETQELRNMIEKRTKNLHKKHKDITLLLRDWLVWWKSWKSVNHLHFHLVPDCPIWADEIPDSDNRERFSHEKYIKNINRIKQTYL